jgi:hypothetical protein
VENKGPGSTVWFGKIRCPWLIRVIDTQVNVNYDSTEQRYTDTPT